MNRSHIQTTYFRLNDNIISIFYGEFFDCWNAPYVKNVIRTQSKWGIITHMMHSHYHGSTAGHAACFDNSKFFCTTNCDYFIKVNSPKSLETMACQPTKITEAIKSV